jgi:DNA-binding CsgD family transcriptional regulator
VREQVRLALERSRRGSPAKSVILVGLRGVGKTVLLRRMADDAERAGIRPIRVETPEDRSLPSVLAPHLRTALERLKAQSESQAQQLASRALRGLAGFVRALKVKYNDIEISLNDPPEAGLADNGDLDSDLPALLEAAGEVARAADTALVMFIDELQYVKEGELAALITALHLCGQRQLPITLVGAGLPALRGNTGKAKSYAERLFEFPAVGPLNREAAEQAIRKPAVEKGIAFDADALTAILDKTEGYPYFLQEWGKHVWETAAGSPITAADVFRAHDVTVAALDASFFSVRLDRLTPAEKRYLRAMAELGPGPHRSGEIAECLGKTVQNLAPLRGKLIQKGMVWSPNHGDTAFTVPLFDEFMRRTIPGDDWRDA